MTIIKGISLIVLSCTIFSAPRARSQLTPILTTDDFLPDGTNRYTGFTAPRLNNDGSIVFEAATSRGGNDNGIFVFANGATRQVARIGDSTPDRDGLFALFRTPSDYLTPYGLVTSSSSNIFFASLLGNSLGGAEDNSGMYHFNGSDLREIARKGRSNPAFSEPFQDLLTSFLRINSRGQIAALATIEGDTLFLYQNGLFTRVAATGDVMPNGDGTMSVWPAALNDEGMLAFGVSVFGSTNGVPGSLMLYRDGELSILAAHGYSVPSGNGKFNSFLKGTYSFPPTLNNRGQIAFVANLRETTGGSSDNEGVFLAEKDKITEVVRKGEFVPGGNGRFRTFYNYVAFNDIGTVVFIADLTGTTGGTSDDSGIFMARDGQITTLARKGQAPPEGNGAFFAFNAFGLYSYPVLNERNDVAFFAYLSGSSSGNGDNTGIYFVSPDQSMQTVVREGQTVTGRKIIELAAEGGFLSIPNPGGGEGFNDNGEIAFAAMSAAGPAIYHWTKSSPESIGSVALAEGNLVISMTVSAGSTNYIQAASSLNPAQGAFTDISGPIFSPTGARFTTNYLVPIINGTSRYFRSRRAP